MSHTDGVGGDQYNLDLSRRRHGGDALSHQHPRHSGQTAVGARQGQTRAGQSGRTGVGRKPSRRLCRWWDSKAAANIAAIRPLATITAVRQHSFEGNTMLNALHRSCWAVAMCASVLAASFADAQSTWAGRKLAAGEFFSVHSSPPTAPSGRGARTPMVSWATAPCSTARPDPRNRARQCDVNFCRQQSHAGADHRRRCYAWGANDDGRLPAIAPRGSKCRALKVSAPTQVAAYRLRSAPAAVAVAMSALGRAVTRSVPAR